MQKKFSLMSRSERRTDGPGFETNMFVVPKL
jgi:hypothetical protein